MEENVRHAVVETSLWNGPVEISNSLTENSGVSNATGYYTIASRIDGLVNQGFYDLRATFTGEFDLSAVLPAGAEGYASWNGHALRGFTTYQTRNFQLIDPNFKIFNFTVNGTRQDQYVQGDRDTLFLNFTAYTYKGAGPVSGNVQIWDTANDAQPIAGFSTMANGHGSTTIRLSWAVMNWTVGPHCLYAKWVQEPSIGPTNYTWVIVNAPVIIALDESIDGNYFMGQSGSNFNVRGNVTDSITGRNCSNYLIDVELYDQSLSVTRNEWLEGLSGGTIVSDAQNQGFFAAGVYFNTNAEASALYNNYSIRVVFHGLWAFDYESVWVTERNWNIDWTNDFFDDVFQFIWEGDL
jgi:hypothetical protein